jgi:hypothetical protein
MTPKALVVAIEERLGILGAPLQIRDAIEHELLERSYDAATAAEQVDLLHLKVANEIRRRQSDSEASGEIAIIHLRNKEIVHGSSFVFADDTDQIRKSKINRVQANKIYQCIRSLNFSQFELFGKCVLGELGCSKARVTPHAGDQGIDFYGELSVGSLLAADQAILKLMHETKVILVGQAKHYPNAAIGPNVVRELVGALSLSRTYTYSNDQLDLLNGVELRPFSPVLALLFSTGAFTKGARNLAGRAGLIAFSGWQLAVFLADRGIGLVETAGSVAFDQSAFETWLH